MERCLSGGNSEKNGYDGCICMKDNGKIYMVDWGSGEHEGIIKEKMLLIQKKKIEMQQDVEGCVMCHITFFFSIMIKQPTNNLNSKTLVVSSSSGSLKLPFL